MNGYYGIQVKTADMSRAQWLAPFGAAGLRIHASSWKTQEAAQAVLDSIKADPRNAHIIGKVVQFK